MKLLMERGESIVLMANPDVIPGGEYCNKNFGKKFPGFPFVGAGSAVVY